MFDYRETLYSNYFNNHSGRGFENNEQERFDTQKRYFRREILPLIQGDKGMRIIDLGCGTGSLISMLQDSGYTNVTGLDVSEDQLNVARKMGVKDVVKEDIRGYLISHVSSFDVITGIDIIEHLSKDELVDLLKDVKAALKPGGYAIFRTPNADAPLSTLFSRGDFTHETHLNKSSAIQVMGAVGFTKVDVVSGLIFIESKLKEPVRRFLWSCMKMWLKLMLFASGRTWHEVEFGPNIIIVAQRGDKSEVS